MASDYPQGRGRVLVTAAGIEIEGVSIAGHESFYKLPGFRTLLEFGRAPDDVLSYANVCLTHGHLDHAAGLAHYASRRRLTGLAPARVFAPPDAIPDLSALLSVCERLERIEYGIRLIPAAPGERVELRRDLELEFLPGRHRIPTVGYLFREVKTKLRDEFLGRSGAEIAALRGAGTDVTRRETVPLFAYPGDCGPAIFEAAPALFSAKVLLIECSFLVAEDVERAHVYEHLHLQDFLERADLFQNEVIVLTHFSMRYRPEEIRAALRALPPRLADRIIAFLPDSIP